MTLPVEWLQWEERGETVPVHGLARPWRARVPHPHPGLPTAGKDMQSSRCRAHGGPLQVGVDDRWGVDELSMHVYSKLTANFLYWMYLIFN